MPNDLETMRLTPAPDDQAPENTSGLNPSRLALCAALLPVWGRHLATSRTQSEAAVAEMMSAFSEIGPHLDRAARQSKQITAALAQDAGGIINLAQACSQELLPLLGQLEPATAATLQKVLGMVQKSVDDLENLSRPFEHETQMVSQQVERMYVGFQYQDRISQMMTLLHDDMARLEAALSQPTQAPDELTQEAWLARLESQYVMQEQRQHHTGQTASAADAIDDGMDTTFF